MNSKYLETKRHFINGKTIVGIDPAKKNHQAVIIDSIGVPIGSANRQPRTTMPNRATTF